MFQRSGDVKMKKAIVFIVVALFLVSFAFAAYGPGKSPSGSSGSSGSSSSSSGGGGGGGRGIGGLCATGYTKVDGVCVKTEQPAEAAVAGTQEDVADQEVSEQIPVETAAETTPETIETEAVLAAEEIETTGKIVIPGWLWATLAVVAIGALAAVYIHTQKR